MSKTSTPGSPRIWVTQKQAAEHLGLAARTVRAMIADGRLTGYHNGSRTVRLDLAEIDQAMRPLRGDSA